MIVFPSRKNFVTMENDIVTKKFKSVGAMEKERANLEFLGGKQIAVPQILGSSGDELYLKNIEGRTYCELSEDLTILQMEALVNWLDDFHSQTGFSRGDVNLRNFIYNEQEKRCFSVDFEDEFQIANIPRDYARILAFLSTYNPIFSNNKVSTCSFMLEILRGKCVDVSVVNNEYLNELSQMEKRRQVTFDGFTVEKFWREIIQNQ